MDSWITSVDISMLEAIRIPVGVFLILACIFTLFMQHMLLTSYRAEAIELVRYYRRNIGRSFLLSFLWFMVPFQFVIKYLFSFRKKGPKEVFVETSINWCKWLAKDK